MQMVKKNDTHFVVKISDADNFLSEYQNKMFRKYLDVISNSRELNGKSKNPKYSVVNMDEPYSDAISELICLGENIKDGCCDLFKSFTKRKEYIDFFNEFRYFSLMRVGENYELDKNEMLELSDDEFGKTFKYSYTEYLKEKLNNVNNLFRKITLADPEQWLIQYKNVHPEMYPEIFDMDIKVTKPRPFSRDELNKALFGVTFILSKCFGGYFYFTSKSGDVIIKVNSDVMNNFSVDQIFKITDFSDLESVCIKGEEVYQVDDKDESDVEDLPDDDDEDLPDDDEECKIMDDDGN
jgi:hypothetical protein